MTKDDILYSIKHILGYPVIDIEIDMILVMLDVY